MLLSLRNTLILLVSLSTGLPALAQSRPNIVLIVADDIGFSDFGSFGGEIETPIIDALAWQGARFSNFHVASSCAPTRAMLLTGLDNHLAGVGSMRELMPLSHRNQPGYEGVLGESVQTVSALLQAAGYRTSVAGKWHLGVEPGNLPPARGFDYSVIQADSGSDNFEMRPYLPMRPEAYWFDNGERMTVLPEGFYSSTFFVDKTIEFLAEGDTDGAPFFAYLAFQANHTPVQAPSTFIDTYRGRYIEGWAEIRNRRLQKIRQYGLVSEQATVAAGPTQSSWDALSDEQKYFEARRMQAYAGMASAMDYEIGRLVDWLRETGEYGNTVFVVMSDNGATVSEPYDNAFGRYWLESNYHRDVETLGEKGSWVAAGSGWGRVSNTPLSGHKFTAGEGGVRVPLIITGLSGISRGEVLDEFVYVTDLAPTLLAIAGVNAPAPGSDILTMRGQSLLPLLQEGVSPVHPPDESIGYEFSGNAALYRGVYKLVRNQPPVGDGQWQLFDIDTDPGETTDLSDSMPALFLALQEEYARYTGEVGVLPMPEDYSLARQVMINALLFFYLPRYLPYVLGFLLLTVIAIYLVRQRRKLR